MKYLLLIVMLLGIAALPVAAQPANGGIVLYGAEKDRPPCQDTEAARALVAVGGKEFFTIPGPVYNYSACQRREIVETRLTAILSTCPNAPVTVQSVGGKPTVYVGLIRLITAYAGDARATGASSAWALAHEWAAATRAGLQNTAPLVNLEHVCTVRSYVAGIPGMGMEMNSMGSPNTMVAPAGTPSSDQ